MSCNSPVVRLPTNTRPVPGSTATPSAGTVCRRTRPRAWPAMCRAATSFDDPRLRRAAVDRAGTLPEQELPRPRTAVGRVVVALLWLWARGVLGLLLHRLLLGRPEDVNWLSVAMDALLAVWIVRRRRGFAALSRSTVRPPGKRTAAPRDSSGTARRQPAFSASNCASRVRRGRTSTSRTARARAAPLACTIDRCCWARVSAV
jgi:hypothetical protein